MMLTVRKEGPNTGRNFYKCGRGHGGCDFFSWADAGPLHNRTNSSPVVLPQRDATQRYGQFFASLVVAACSGLQM